MPYHEVTDLDETHTKTKILFYNSFGKLVEILEDKYGLNLAESSEDKHDLNTYKSDFTIQYPQKRLMGGKIILNKNKNRVIFTRFQH